MKKQLAAIIGIGAAALLSPAAHAVSDTATVLLPEDVTSSTSDLFGSDVFNDLIGGSYFAGPDIYMKGKNNFNTFVASTKYRTSGVDQWVGSTNSQVVLTFDFGEIVTIEGFALWNDYTDAAIDEFNLIGDFRNNGMYNAADPGQDLVISGLADQGQLDDQQRVSAQTFDFITTYSTRYVFLQIRSTWDPESDFVSAAQVAFAQSATPVPFELGPIPGIIGIVAVGGINYFRNSKGEKDK